MSRQSVAPVTTSFASSDQYATKMLVQAFILCHLDYCNSLLFGISDGLLCCLQLIQNAATRLVTASQAPLIVTTSHPWQLHWLPVRQRVVLVHQSLVGAALVYLADEKMTVAFCRMMVVARCGPIPVICEAARAADT